MPSRRPLSLEDRTKTIGEVRIDASDLLQERLSCGGDGTTELVRSDRPHEGGFPRARVLDPEVVDPASIRGHEVVSKARQRQPVVPGSRDPVFGLPRSATLDRRTRVQQEDPAPLDQRIPVGCVRRLGRALAEDELEGRPVGSERCRRCQRDVDLEAVA
jgi:hypothetical protein